MSFDRFAAVVSGLVAKPAFFAFTVLMVALWFPTLFLMKVDTSQLIINTSTTILTTWLVALLHNDQRRTERALVKALDDIAAAVGVDSDAEEESEGKK